jgi:hypothetical protein
VDPIDVFGNIAPLFPYQVIRFDLLNSLKLGSHGRYLGGGKKAIEGNESISVVGFDLQMGEAHRQTP